MDTIVAIATATGKGGIGIIRMSGDKCHEIINKIFIPKNDKQACGYSIKYGYIVDDENKPIDEVLVSFFMEPKSYTRENMCEINSHGGKAVERAILEECIKNGARLAEPGEFTKRAFLNGRIDLSQAEAVIDLINAKTERERKTSINQLEGILSARIRKIKDELLNLMTDIEVNIDYPEYDEEEITTNKINVFLDSINEKLIKLSNSYKNGKIIKEGIKTAIVGKTNVGKSSLLNLLLNEERAIVSNIEGTTRDTIEESIIINGIELKIIDTAGVRETSDEIEKIGVKKTINIINHAELIIAIFDDSRALDEEDIQILEMTKNKNTIVLINKTDLGLHKIDLKKIQEYKHEIIKFSVKDEAGINELYEEINKMFELEQIEEGNEEMITNIRQKEHIDNSMKIIQQVKELIKKEVTLDIISIHIRKIIEELGNITGDNVTEDIINTLFSKFCIGK